MSAAPTPAADVYAAVPAELRAVARWICWKREPEAKRPHKPRKVPMQARAIGRRASSTDPGTWARFGEALSALAAAPDYAGIGFVFDGSDGLVGVDLDHSLDPATGDVLEWACPIVEALDSYTEVTPSGTGLHVIARGALPPEHRKRGDVEMYEAGRYFTVTGRWLATSPPRVMARAAQLRDVHARYLAPPVPGPAPAALAAPARVPDETDADILERARSARNGGAFSALYDRGEWDLMYASRSEADLALCSRLAYWTGGDAARVDALFRGSGLYRDKWDQKRGAATYGARTIARALAGGVQICTPPPAALGWPGGRTPPFRHRFGAGR